MDKGILDSLTQGTPAEPPRNLEETSRRPLRTLLRRSDGDPPLRTLTLLINKEMRAPIKEVRLFKVQNLVLRLKWPFTGWETGPEQKSRENGKENGKSRENGKENGNGPAAKWPKVGVEMEKNEPLKRDFGQFLAIFPFRRPFSGHFGLGPFSIFFPIFLGVSLRAGFPFCKWPLPLQT